METEYKIGDVATFHTTENDMMAFNNHKCKIVGVTTMPYSDTKVYSVEFANLVVNVWPDELKNN